MRKVILTALLLSFIGWIFPSQVQAQEDGIQIILKDGFYGGLVGALVGGALLAFRDDPGEHIDLVAQGGKVLFVGTKRQASEQIADAAKRCGQYYVNHRWLGGMLTNWRTITASIRRLKEYDELLAEGDVGLTKKELLMRTRDRDKLERALGGIKEMGGLPDILVVIDTNKEGIAVKEATKLNIPVVAVLDSNCDPAGITFPVPGNDDAIRSIALYCGLFSDAVLDGLQQEAIAAGSDIGEAVDALTEANVEAPAVPDEVAQPAVEAAVLESELPPAVG